MSRELARQIADRVPAVGGSFPAVTALALALMLALEEHDETPGGLSDLLGIPISTTILHVNVLITNGWAERVRTFDHRKSWIRLTPKGLRMLWSARRHPAKIAVDEP